MWMDRKKHIAIFTTASLPWMTGTAVNPLFRSAYLTKLGAWRVTLVIPWLSIRDQELVYPDKITFASPSEHASYVRQWLSEKIGSTPELDIRFYPAKFSVDKRSILSVGDITEAISDEEAGTAVLEEPEHLTWYHHGQRWKTKFQWVVGVVHTNYLEYVKREKNGALQAFFLKRVNSLVAQIYCHKVIRLSAATQDFPRSVVCNVHGVSPIFLEIGRRNQEQQQIGNQVFTRGAYYIGKMLWSKGYKELLHLISRYQHQLGNFQIDLYGSGEDFSQVREAAAKLKLNVNVYPGRDHADPLFLGYKVFINPSTTDVVCTTTAEALAMGKIVVCASHPSNDFFKQFPNCRTYKDHNGFVTQTLKALEDEPFPMSDAHRYELSWESATEKFLDAAELEHPHIQRPGFDGPHKFMSLSFHLPNLRKNLENAVAYIHYTASGIEATRRAFGAIPDSLQPDEEQCKELGWSSPS